MNKTLLLINAGSTYEWGELITIDESTYSIPIYLCEVVSGKHVGEKIGAGNYYRKIIFNSKKG